MARRASDPAVKEARGNPGRRPIAAAQARPDLASDARAPAWLKGEARAIWNRLSPELTQVKLLARLDELTFGRYCVYFAQWQTAMAAVEVEGLVETTSSDHVTMTRLNKNLHAAILLDKRLTDLEDRFGLNPAKRQAIFAQRAAAGASLPGELPLDAPSPGSDDAFGSFLN